MADLTLGILGGGQLGLMMLDPARRLGIRTIVLDPAADAPCASRADTFILGGLSDADKIAEVVRRADVTTYEIEHIDTAALQSLANDGAVILPAPASLATIQDKLHQRRFFKDHSLPVPEFTPVTDERSPFDYPVVQKARRGGYDGRGVFILKHSEEKPAPVESFWERYIDLSKELSVLVARSSEGEIRCYDPVEMVVDAEGRLLKRAVSPARVSTDTSRYARRLAEATVTLLEGAGLFAVELLLSTDGTLYINEVAPRPHNSGHHTIEAAQTSQFEQHIRAVCGLPLGSTRARSAAVTINLVGTPNGRGAPEYNGLEEVLREEGAALHLYGKSEVRPWRKMGHVTLFGDSLDELLNRADGVEALLSVGVARSAHSDPVGPAGERSHG